MQIYVVDDQEGRYFRRTQVGLRFLAHGARTQTVCQWTKLTPEQVGRHRRRFGFKARDRLRGPSPSSFEFCFSSRRARNQAALFLCICRIVGVQPPRGDEPNLDIQSLIVNGERFCSAFEIFNDWEPQANLEIEQAVLLVTGVAQGLEIGLEECEECSTLFLIDKLLPSRNGCPACRKSRSASAETPQITS